MTAPKKHLPSLKAMAEEKTLGIRKATIFKVDPDLVEFEDGFNLRNEGPELDAHLERLYVAMKAGAFVPPIDVTVEGGRVIVRDGHCRTRTARRLKAEGIDYALEARQFRGNESDCILHMLSSAQGKSLTPLEQGRGFLRLTRYHMSIVQIAETTGLHRSTIDTYLSLATSPVALQDMITSGEVSVHVALDAIRKHGDKAVKVLQKLIGKVKQEGGKKVTKKHVSKFKVPPAVVTTFITTAKAIREQVDADQLAYLADNDTIEVPVGLLREMLDAQRKAEGEDDEL